MSGRRPPEFGKESDPQDPRLDPMERRQAQLAPPSFAPLTPAGPIVDSSAAAPSATARAAASLEALMPALVKRIAFSGDARRGAVRMELGGGALSGGTILIQADHGDVSVRLSAPRGVDASAWGDKIRQCLEARGLHVTSVECD